MNNKEINTPVVMSFTCGDATGSMGVQADVETMAFLGTHCAPVLSALTIQDSCSIKDLVPIPASVIIEQARTVLHDMPVAAFKIGLLGNEENIVAVSNLIGDYPNIPVIYDPMLRVTDQLDDLEHAEIELLRDTLCAQSTVITVHNQEIAELSANADTLDACAQDLMELGTDYVFISRAVETTSQIENVLYGNRRHLKSYTWERFKPCFNGAGCTLSAATAAFISQGLDPQSALSEAQAYTWQTLKHGRRFGMGNHLPNRWYHLENSLQQ